MAYPTSFDMDEFKKLNKFSQRYKYCKERLEYISSGSARYVFGIDNDKVLKLAKNPKGIAQNETEYKTASDMMCSGVAKVFDVDDDYLWLEMERVDKIKIAQFEQGTGMKFKDFASCIRYYWDTFKNGGNKWSSKPSCYDEAWENDFFCDISELMVNFNMSSGDLCRINSYGITQSGDIKLVDAGLDEDVQSNYYR